MISKCLFPDVVTYNLLIGAACNIGRLDFALLLHDQMVQRGYEPDLITYTELVRGFCIRGKMKEARGGNLGDEGRGQRVIGRQRRGVEVWVRHEKKMTEREEMSRSGLESKYNRMSVRRRKKRRRKKRKKKKRRS